MHTEKNTKTIERYQALAQLYCDKKTFVYILIGEGRWYNGYIESVQGQVLMFKDRYIEDSIPIFITEIDKIEPSKQKVVKA